MDETFQARTECLLAIDEMIGNLTDELEHQGVLQNTYVIFSSDNGYHLGQHRLPGGKRSWFEHDINLPLIISGPGIAKGSTINEMVGNYDLAPTWAELTGAVPTVSAPPVDGISFASLLKDNKGTWPRTFTLTEGYQNFEGVKKCCGRYHGLRIRDKDENSVYVELEAGEIAYFDTAKDPAQTKNVYNSLPSDKKRKLAAQLKAVQACAGKACPGHGSAASDVEFV
jgi:arylsulfatase A-like enzyme